MPPRPAITPDNAYVWSLRFDAAMVSARAASSLSRSARMTRPKPVRRMFQVRTRPTTRKTSANW